MPSKWSSFDERFWAKVEKGADCWLWTAATNADGYGVIGAPGGRGAGTLLAHRVAWQFAHGQFPDTPLDHLCSVRNCVNPAHLEAVTQAENIRRSPHVGKRKAKT